MGGFAMTSGRDWFEAGRSERPAPVPLPSILDLARQAGAASLRADQLGDQSYPQRQDDSDLMISLYDEAAHLRDVLLTVRARTLTDATAQMFAGFLAAEEMEDFDLPADERSRCVTAIRRALLSALPVVAEAALLDLAEIGAERIADFADREFPADA
jgi:hypothetical protein